ncbi:hypothetical protein ACN469_31375 [Corallococcus terminator]
MDWPRVFEFIQQRAPAFLSGLEGVPDAAISALAAERGVTLPGCYVEFLRRMGGDSNGYRPFGATQDHRFSIISERLREEDDAPDDRVFLVAVETDESQVALYDHHLDLRHVEDDDTPLVLLEQGIPFDGHSQVEYRETFGERITASVFNHFELSRRAHHEVVYQSGGVLPEAVTLLRSAGFAPVLPLLGRVACLQEGALGVHAQVNEEYGLLSLRLGGDDPKAVEALVTRLLAELPEARRPTRPRGRG